MIDETTDRKTDKQLVILARAFQDDDVSTRFLGMPVCNLSTAEDLFKAVDSCLRYSIVLFACTLIRLAEIGVYCAF